MKPDPADLFCNAAADACALGIQQLDQLRDLLCCILSEADDPAKVRELAAEALGVHDELANILSLTVGEPADQDEEL